jgi:succinylglutamic semialdehyde dehydrogenase
VNHRDIAGVLFTGSYSTGKALHKALAGRLDVLLALEMGGNNPLIVWDVADVAAAATLIIQSAYISSGQRCTCARRLIVPAGEQGDVLIEALLARIDSIRIGGAFDEPAPFMGPLIHNRIVDELLKMQEWYKAAGATILRPMVRLQAGLPFITAGLADVTRKSNVPDVEFFGPFLQVKRVRDWESAMVEANQTSYGLAAGLLSDRKELWEQFIRDVRAGVVNWNRPTTGANSGLPFGGVGLSGNHRPSAYYAADYCAYPVASLMSEAVVAPQQVVGLEHVP